MEKVSVVIPVYNEQNNLRPLTEELLRVLEGSDIPSEILFVDDASTDDSPMVLRELVSNYRNIRVLTFEYNCGQSAAFDAGFRNASGDIIVTMDADMQNDPADIPKLLENIDDYDMVCGWRWNRQDSFSKRISSKIANAVRRKNLNDRFKDVGCSLKAYHKKCFERLKLFKGMHRFLPILFEMEGFKVLEVKVNHRQRAADESKYNLWNRVFKSHRDMKAVAWMQKNRLDYRIKGE
jgi:glycosyltransferase involved in cell wall biosynthesis